MNNLPASTGHLLGQTEEDIVGTTDLLGHDLNSPIATVISTLDMLIGLIDSDVEKATVQYFLKGALAAARRERNMLFDLLDLARFEMDQYELKLEPVDMGLLLRKCLDEEAFVVETKKVQLEVDIPSGAGLVAEVEIELFQRVFSAILDNIMKFTVKGDRIRVEARREENRLMFRFSDTGRPFSTELLGKVASRAPHWNQRQAGSRTSVGMGLPFVSAVLKAHQGSLEIKSQPAPPLTEFILTIPGLNLTLPEG
ncbi:MAG: HAMP domain-containing histidine kinase [Anaerolineae bacterium]|nr:HAMP domain-containing histidine kinase [Anaerolineae bacterium]